MGKKWKMWQTLFSWAPKSLQTVTAAMKLRHLHLGRKAVTILDCVLKSRHHFADKDLSSQSYDFPVVMYRCGSWTIKKAECQRVDDFKLWCCRRLLRLPWMAGRANKPVLKETNPEYSLEGMILKPLYFGHLMERVNSMEKTLMLVKIEGKRRKG